MKNITGGIRLYTSIKDIPANQYFEFQKFYMIWKAYDPVRYSDAVQVKQTIESLAVGGSKKIKELSNYLNNYTLAVWRSDDSANPLMNAFLALSVDLLEVDNALAERVAPTLSYESIFNEVSLILISFENELNKNFDTNEGQQRTLINALYRNVDIFDPASLGHLRRKMAALFNVESYHPDVADNFIDAYDKRIAAWADCLGFSGADMKAITAFDFFIRNENENRKAEQQQQRK